MSSHFRIVIGAVVGLGILMVLLHLGNQGLQYIGTFSPLVGAITGGVLTLVSVNIRLHREGDKDPWIGREKLGWNLIGCGCIGWAIGESIWRYYILNGLNPFPSWADCGYATLSPLIFFGLILQPFSKSTHKQVFLLLDSLIAMGALLSIAWFLLLGPLAQTPAESEFTKFMGLYYPTADVALVSCIIFLLLRGANEFSTRARRISLLVLGIGMAVYANSDFLFNIMLTIGAPLDGTWVDLGWPLGIMAIGVAAYLRRFLPRSNIEEQEKPRVKRLSAGFSQAVPYLLLSILFLVLAINVLSTNPTQQSIRPVLIIATFIVIGLLIARQVFTIRENERLMREAQKIAELEAIEIKRQEEELAMSQQIEDGIQHILATLNTVVTRNDFTMRVPLKQENILWRVGRSINNLLSRLQGFRQNQEELRRTHAIALAVAQYMRDGHPIQLNSWTGTALDPVIIEYNKRFKSTPEQLPNTPVPLAKSHLIPNRPKP
jgi:hypothetical protein